MQALSWDPHARDWLTAPMARGAVVAVYPRALQVEGIDGRLLSVVEEAAGNAPMTLVVRLPGGIGFHEIPIVPDAPAMTRASTLYLGELALDLEGVALWLQGGWPAGPIPRPLLRRRTGSLHTALRQVGRRAGLCPVADHLDDLLLGAAPPPGLDLLGRFAWPHLAGLAACWLAGRPLDAASHAAGLVGLGPGATPSGDDLLAGLMVALRRGLLASGRSERAADRFAVRCLALAAPTTRLGQARLDFAAAGEIDQRFDELFAAIFAPDGPSNGCLWHLAERAARLGHSSGTDTLVGVLLGLKLAQVGHRSSRAPEQLTCPDLSATVAVFRAAVETARRFPMVHEHLNPASLYPPSRNAYTQIVTSTGTRQHHISGIVSMAANRELVGENDMRAQAECVVENIGRALEAVGVTPAHVVRMNVFTTDVDWYLAEASLIVSGFFGGAPPASTLVGVTRLADPRYLVEVEVTAVSD